MNTSPAAALIAVLILLWVLGWMNKKIPGLKSGGKFFSGLLKGIHHVTWQQPREIRGFWFTATLWALLLSAAWFEYAAYQASRKGVDVTTPALACTICYYLWTWIKKRKKHSKTLPHLRKRRHAPRSW